MSDGRIRWVDRGIIDGEAGARTGDVFNAHARRLPFSTSCSWLLCSLSNTTIDAGLQISTASLRRVTITAPSSTWCTAFSKSPIVRCVVNIPMSVRAQLNVNARSRHSVLHALPYISSPPPVSVPRRPTSRLLLSRPHIPYYLPSQYLQEMRLRLKHTRVDHTLLLSLSRASHPDYDSFTHLFLLYLNRLSLDVLASRQHSSDCYGTYLPVLRERGAHVNLWNTSLSFSATNIAVDGFCGHCMKSCLSLNDSFMCWSSRTLTKFLLELAQVRVTIEPSQIDSVIRFYRHQFPVIASSSSLLFFTIFDSKFYFIDRTHGPQAMHPNR
ncbi:hypothetical protein BDN70DRAFT_964147 [Pholiota conissans]|uniref:Uncharacterized protein n=1 Tax=Pholiota conissans TaxID=109636 RepID=A0A9P6CVI9_9AGAR|nr:hypothetical protein BDN70DRAFT_964147 [Pholiota conissans]